MSSADARFATSFNLDGATCGRCNCTFTCCPRHRNLKACKYRSRVVDKSIELKMSICSP